MKREAQILRKPTEEENNCRMSNLETTEVNDCCWNMNYQDEAITVNEQEKDTFLKVNKFAFFIFELFSLLRENSTEISPFWWYLSSKSVYL